MSFTYMHHTCNTVSVKMQSTAKQSTQKQSYKNTTFGQFCDKYLVNK